MPEPEGLIAPLREDLILTPAPTESGAPVWMVFDPAASAFLRADWAHFEILKCLDRPQTFTEVLLRLQEKTTLRLPPEEVRSFLRDLMLRNLLRSRLVRDTGELQQERQQSRLPAWGRLLRNYLYFRLPLLRPDAFLERTLRHVLVLVSRGAVAVYALFALCGLYFLSQHVDRYIRTVPDFLNWRGALAFGIAVMLVKAVHEFAHAYAAKAFGNRVPAMGLAFIVLWPVPYCDVTDSWRMDSRRKRMLISAAGILCELVLAAMALTLWGLSEHPLAKAVFFMLSSASLAGTLLVNLNPAMRFDGYYLLCDLLGIDNLYSRAGEYLRWCYRNRLLGLPLPDPELQTDEKRRRFLAIYGGATWLYRLFLYFGIALVVYHAFPKIIGIILFALEILVFILRPAAGEIGQLWRMRAQAKPRPCALSLAAAAVLLLLWAGLPLPRYTGIAAVYEPGQTQVIYAPQSGMLRQVCVQSGTRVNKGDLLAVVESPELEQKLRVATARANEAEDLLKREMASGKSVRRLELLQQLAGARALALALETQIAGCRICADVCGVVCNWKDTALPGTVVGKRHELGMIAGRGAGRVKAYMPSSIAAFAPRRGRVTFISSADRQKQDVDISHMAQIREHELRHSGLSTEYGGQITVSSGTPGRPQVEGNYFLLYANATPPPLAGLPDGQPAGLSTLNGGIGGGQTGTLCYWSGGRSYIAAHLRSLWRVFLRESGF